MWVALRKRSGVSTSALTYVALMVLGIDRDAAIERAYWRGQWSWCVKLSRVNR